MCQFSTEHNSGTALSPAVSIRFQGAAMKEFMGQTLG